MKFNLELPNDTLIMKREDLRDVLKLLIVELHAETAAAEIMTIKQAAEYMQVSVPTIRNLIAAKAIPFFQRGQIIRMNRWALNQWMEGKD